MTGLDVSEEELMEAGERVYTSNGTTTTSRASTGPTTTFQTASWKATSTRCQPKAVPMANSRNSRR